MISLEAVELLSFILPAVCIILISLWDYLSLIRSFQAALHHFCTNVWIKHENCQTVCCDCFWCFCVQTGMKEIKVILISGCDSEMISVFQQLSGQQRDNRADKSSLKQVSGDSLAHWQLHEWRSQLDVQKSSCVCNKAWVCEERTCSTPADGCFFSGLCQQDWEQGLDLLLPEVTAADEVEASDRETAPCFIYYHVFILTVGALTVHAEQTSAAAVLLFSSSSHRKWNLSETLAPPAAVWLKCVELLQFVCQCE